MKYTDFNKKTHGFAGHMAEPADKTDKAVIVIMGGEKSILPGIKIAQRFAALIAEYIGGIENVVMVSPSHVPFEGTPDKKQMTGHSVVTWHGKELSFVNADFTKYRAMKYYHDSRTEYRVTGMWKSYQDAYADKKAESEADIHIEKLNARILLLAGTGDEMWPSDYSVKYLEKSLRENHYGREYKAVLYEGASHLLGIMPNRKRNPMLYKMIPLIGIFYRRFRENRSACMDALEKSEREIVEWIGESR
ncbi:MAG: hypothetical protein NC300_04625 [Bacteroidales bacterium]|nr:hypothetical protein [Clostridium sp.]MCM1203405.1 hypothetical protein [Bacteroidales bacterium]